MTDSSGTRRPDSASAIPDVGLERCCCYYYPGKAARINNQRKGMISLANKNEDFDHVSRTILYLRKSKGSRLLVEVRPNADR